MPGSKVPTPVVIGGESRERPGPGIVFTVQLSFLFNLFHAQKDNGNLMTGFRISVCVWQKRTLLKKGLFSNRDFLSQRERM